MLAARYVTKRALEQAVGQRLRYEETSIFGAEYRPDGKLMVVGPSPYERRWYAEVTMREGRIEKVS